MSLSGDSHQSDEESVLVNTRESLIPVTIKQLHRALENWHPRDDVFIDGQPRKNIFLVGLIHSASADGRDVVYEINDGTGSITVLDYAPGDRSAAPLQRETYCRVIGRLAPSEGARPVCAFSVQSVTNFDLIPYHALQALYVHMHVTRGPVPAPANRREERSRESLTRREIVRLLSSGDRVEGTARRDIIRALSRSFSVEEIETAIEGLRSDSVIYPGRDDRLIVLL
jgi:hypothetical protein